MKSQEKPLILVVDDEIEVLENVANVLTEAGFDCQCCNSAQGAIAFEHGVDSIFQLLFHQPTHLEHL